MHINKFLGVAIVTPHVQSEKKPRLLDFFYLPLYLSFYDSISIKSLSHAYLRRNLCRTRRCRVLWTVFSVKDNNKKIELRLINLTKKLCLQARLQRNWDKFSSKLFVCLPKTLIFFKYHFENTFKTYKNNTQRTDICVLYFSSINKIYISSIFYIYKQSSLIFSYVEYY